MARTPFDYTTKRLGSRTPDGKIVKCPKCGRKGALHLSGYEPNGKPLADHVLHAGYMEDAIGMSMRTLSDLCGLPLSPMKQAQIDAWNEAYVRTGRASEGKRAAQEVAAKWAAQHGE